MVDISTHKFFNYILSISFSYLKTPVEKKIREKLRHHLKSIAIKNLRLVTSKFNGDGGVIEKKKLIKNDLKIKNVVEQRRSSSRGTQQQQAILS